MGWKKTAAPKRRGNLWTQELLITAVAHLRHGVPRPAETLQKCLGVLEGLVGDIDVQYWAMFRTEDYHEGFQRGESEWHDPACMKLSECRRNFQRLFRSRRRLPLVAGFAVEHLGVGQLFYAEREAEEDRSLAPYLAMNVYPSMVGPWLKKQKALSPEEAARTPNDPTIRNAVRDWFAIVDETGAASSGLGVCETAAIINYGDYYSTGQINTSWMMEVEYVDWLTSGEDRHRRVRSPAWCTYLSKEQTDRVDPKRTMAAEFMEERAYMCNSQHAEYLPGGGSVYFICNDPMELGPETILGMRDMGIVVNAVWLWQRLRKAGMV